MGSAAHSGGLPVIRPDPIVCGKQQGLFFQSDQHLGAANVDYGLQLRELEAARKRGDRILLGGDLFDLILPADRKRYSPGALHPRLRGRADILNEAIEWGVEHFAPFADCIDAVGVGNHETAALKCHAYDAVTELVRRLNDIRQNVGVPIAEAGYTAFIQYRLQAESGATAGRYLIWYHHGSGKTSQTAAALKRLSSAANSFAADLYWSGHSHAKASAREVMTHCSRSGQLVTRDQVLLITGSYMQAYGNQSQGSMLRKGRRSNYASEAGLAPHGMGGARVVLHWDSGPGFPSRVEVQQ